jgi:hypothetical protein
MATSGTPRTSADPYGGKSGWSGGGLCVRRRRRGPKGLISAGGARRITVPRLRRPAAGRFARRLAVGVLGAALPMIDGQPRPGALRAPLKT